MCQQCLGTHSSIDCYFLLPYISISHFKFSGQIRKLLDTTLHCLSSIHEQPNSVEKSTKKTPRHCCWKWERCYDKTTWVVLHKQILNCQQLATMFQKASSQIFVVLVMLITRLCTETWRPWNTPKGYFEVIPFSLKKKTPTFLRNKTVLLGKPAAAQESVSIPMLISLVGFHKT